MNYYGDEDDSDEYDDEYGNEAFSDDNASSSSSEQQDFEVIGGLGFQCIDRQESEKIEKAYQEYK
jgi:hypothetical protein